WRWRRAARSSRRWVSSSRRSPTGTRCSATRPSSSIGCSPISNVSDPDDLDVLDAGRRSHLDDVAFLGAQQSFGDGRDPADMALVELNLGDGDDLDRAFVALTVGVGHGGAEEDLLRLR